MVSAKISRQQVSVWKPKALSIARLKRGQGLKAEGQLCSLRGGYLVLKDAGTLLPFFFRFAGERGRSLSTTK